LWLVLGAVGIVLIVGAVIASFLGMFLTFITCGIPDAGCPLDETPGFGWLMLGIGFTIAGTIGFLLSYRARRGNQSN
jgi:hypothetical protein